MSKTWTIDAEGVEELAESAFQDCSHVRRFHLPAIWSTSFCPKD